MTNPYTFTDNPMVSGVSVCNTDIVNDNIMALKWMHDHITFRQIGEIVTSTIPLEDAGLHLLDGALISGSGSYGDFVTYISGLVSTYPDLFTTESDWQTSVTKYGVCGKFVYNSTNHMVRLPKITGFTESTIDVNALGDLVEAGLPNITGNFTQGTPSGQTFTNLSSSGAFSMTSAAGAGAYSSGSSIQRMKTLDFDASDSNSIYGNSITVQPQSVKVLYYIVVATTTKTEIEVDIDEIATDLNGKADTDLSNASPTSAFATAMNTAGIRTVVETYVSGTSWYRVYSDKWCEQGGRKTGTNAVTVDLLKHYADTNYSVFVNGIENGTSTGGITVQFYGARTLTTSSFVLQTSSSLNNVVWQACGYIR